MTESRGTLNELCIGTIRVLGIDTVENTASGHPGMPMGAATMAYALGPIRRRRSASAAPSRSIMAINAIPSCPTAGTAGIPVPLNDAVAAVLVSF
jgi:Transketolase, thiamine diphosphate binding domain